MFDHSSRWGLWSSNCPSESSCHLNLWKDDIKLKKKKKSSCLFSRIEAFLSPILSSGSNKKVEKAGWRKLENETLFLFGLWSVSVGHFSALCFCRHVTRLSAPRTRHRFPAIPGNCPARLTRKSGIDTPARRDASPGSYPASPETVIYCIVPWSD